MHEQHLQVDVLANNNAINACHMAEDRRLWHSLQFARFYSYTLLWRHLKLLGEKVKLQ